MEGFELNNQSYKTGDYDMLQYLGIMVTGLCEV